MCWDVGTCVVKGSKYTGTRKRNDCKIVYKIKSHENTLIDVDQENKKYETKTKTWKK